ncbi:MAG TPA: purine-nucleoside phosphorylase [Gemmatimonadaceae bacterium]|nr:purine-nucleoside phosphorylase [Gemmatimonadaceae bacterium]
MTPAGSQTGAPDAGAAAEVVRERLRPEPPALAIILGSGLSGLARRIQNRREMPFDEVPGFTPPTVAGHPGRLIAGVLAERPVLALAGRLHLYEGHSAAACAFPVRVLHALGASVLLVSNAAGGLRRTFRPGHLMAINDHISVAWRNPLIGPVVTGDERFPDMSDPYDPGLRVRLHAAARTVGIALQDGVYAWVTGPAYETPAEIRMLDRLGADAVGMSTVPEVIVARALGMRVAGVSCITNMASGISSQPISHDEVLRVTAHVAETFEALATEFVRCL